MDVNDMVNGAFDAELPKALPSASLSEPASLLLPYDQPVPTFPFTVLGLVWSYKD